jgi:hypothetical protein
VPAGALVFASSVFDVARFDKFTVTGLGSSETFACPAVPVIETPVTCTTNDSIVKPAGG